MPELKNIVEINYFPFQEKQPLTADEQNSLINILDNLLNVGIRLEVEYKSIANQPAVKIPE